MRGRFAACDGLLDRRNDAGGIDEFLSAQPLSRGTNVSVFGCALRTGSFRLLKVSPVTDAEPVVHDKDNESTTRQVLV